MAKRYAYYDGEMVEAPGSSYNGRLKYVLETDYTDLERDNDGAYQTIDEQAEEIKTLQAECERLRGELKKYRQSHERIQARINGERS